MKLLGLEFDILSVLRAAVFMDEILHMGLYLAGAGTIAFSE